MRTAPEPVRLEQIGVVGVVLLVLLSPRIETLAMPILLLVSPFFLEETSKRLERNPPRKRTRQRTPRPAILHRCERTLLCQRHDF